MIESFSPFPSGLEHPPQVVIIGGKGQMGKVFRRIFLQAKCKVRVIDRKDFSDKNLDWNKNLMLLKSTDIAVIAVPINQTLKMIVEVAPHMNTRGVLMDITSLKKSFIDKMKELFPGEIVGTHPLFGPLKIIKGQSIAVMSVKKGKWYRYLDSVFRYVGLKVFETDPQIHDQTMGIVQSLIHFISIALSASVAEQKSQIGNSLENLTTQYYQLHKNLAGRLLDQDPELYADIAFLNQNIVPVLESFQKNFQILIDYLKQDNRRGFIDFFKNCSENETDKDRAYYLIERVMGYLTKLENKA